ncbi:rhodanese-like domain-containing protein [Vibrio sp. SCSIO 43137]|uniref:rhodanese-like domain-containing protein n=1 Tax=Vibrio sp. SCSIO 43137 TaxID=3021011 RepID=UPI0023071AAB|nr:rhodanese-like domain-containing protein [Vibrio sp. SCSIO 43137]WCE28849.1 rhodanese-like domain-containing protein [Vibrio sp. SCSIO 43137]
MLKNFLQRITLFSLAAFFSSVSLAMTFDEIDRLNPSSYQVIDTRTSDLFNGWPDEGMKRGGHYPAAINFPAGWLDSLSDSEIITLLSERGIESDKPSYLYGKNADRLKAKFKQLGYKKIDVISQPLSQYHGELTALERYQQLVSAKWLKALIDNKQPMHKPAKDYKVIEVAWGEPTRYLVSHIPGALYLNTNRIETEQNHWNRVLAKELKQVLESLGVRYDTTVILYSDSTMAAARAANLFMYAGVEDVRLLDGGWQGWEKKPYPTEAFLQHADAVEFGKKVPSMPEFVIDIPQAESYLANPVSHSLVSIRTWPEFIGETSGYSYIKPKGRIAGARWGRAGSDSYHMEDFHNPDGTMLSQELITQNWQEWNIHKNQKVAFHCGTGWRASEAFFYAYLMGWKNISVFDGGWFEWSMDSSNPVASGEVTPDKLR